MDKKVADCNTFHLNTLSIIFERSIMYWEPESVPSEMIKSFGWKNIPGSTDFNIIKKLCDNLEK